MCCSQHYTQPVGFVIKIYQNHEFLIILVLILPNTLQSHQQEVRWRAHWFPARQSRHAQDGGRWRASGNTG